MRLLRHALQRFTSDMLDLPKDVIFNLPRMTIIGNLQMYIENHRGVLYFSDSELQLKLNAGMLKIHGKELVIRAIFPEEVFIEGIVEEVKYIAEKNDGGGNQR